MPETISASAHFPAYFSLDATVSDGRPAPVVRALDEALSHAFLLSQARNLSLDPGLYPLERERRMLGLMGLACATLSDEAAHALFVARHEILAGRGTLGSVRRLLAIWAPGAEARKGWPLAATRASQPSAGPWRVGDDEGSRRLVFVRLARPLSGQSVAELRAAAEELLPMGWRLVIAPPSVARVRAKRGIRLSGRLVMQARKL